MRSSILVLTVLVFLGAFCCKLPGQEVSASPSTDSPPNSSATVDRLILVTGAGGTDAYAAEHAQWAKAWANLAEESQWELKQFVAVDQPQKPGLVAELKAAATDASGRVWLVLIGHGTSSPTTNKFNLVGEDISASELAGLLDAITAPTIVVGCFSASGGFLPKISRPGRVVVTATRSANELNYARFGGPLSKALGDAAADLDHDREVSLLEAFLAASAETQRYYADNNRLASEHAIFDDNGDQVGTPADFFVGVRAVGRAKGKQSPDGRTASKIIVGSLPGAIKLSESQQIERAQLESQIDALRELKSDLPQKDYYEQLEILMLRVAKIYDAAEAK